MSLEKQYDSCPNCGEKRGIGGGKLGIYRCACGQIYCDHCTMGGLIDLPMCPVSAYHEGREKVGVVGNV